MLAGQDPARPVAGEADGEMGILHPGGQPRAFRPAHDRVAGDVGEEQTPVLRDPHRAFGETHPRGQFLDLSRQDAHASPSLPRAQRSISTTATTSAPLMTCWVLKSTFRIASPLLRTPINSTPSMVRGMVP